MEHSELLSIFGSAALMFVLSSPAGGVNKILTFALICGNSIFNGRDGDGGGAVLNERFRSISEHGC